MSEHPLLVNEDQSKIIAFLSVAVRLAHTLDPGFVEQVRQTVATGGLPALIDSTRRALIEDQSLGDADASATEAALRPVGHHRAWTREQRKELIVHCETLRGLEETVGLSGKTIKQELQRHGLTAPWMRLRNGASPAAGRRSHDPT